jgi:K+-transporting ATPase ATPase C chain
MRALLSTAAAMTAVLTLSLGMGYPLLVTGVAHLLFPWQANGSLIVQGGRVVGSTLIGQPFHSQRYFWGRPSATTPYPDNAASSQGSNLAPTNAALLDAVNRRISQLRSSDPANHRPVPIDLVTSSGSGLDPDITPAAAYYQAARVARARGISVESVRRLIRDHIEERQFGLLGERRVNVLELNVTLDRTQR